MQIENNKEEIPFAHYEAKFRELNPQDALSRLPSVAWNGKEFTVKLLGKGYAISHPDYAIRALDEEKLPSLPSLKRFIIKVSTASSK